MILMKQRAPGQGVISPEDFKEWMSMIAEFEEISLRQTIIKYSPCFGQTVDYLKKMMSPSMDDFPVTDRVHRTMGYIEQLLTGKYIDREKSPLPEPQKPAVRNVKRFSSLEDWRQACGFTTIARAADALGLGRQRVSSLRHQDFKELVPSLQILMHYVYLDVTDNLAKGEPAPNKLKRKKILKRKKPPAE